LIYLHTFGLKDLPGVHGFHSTSGTPVPNTDFDATLESVRLQLKKYANPADKLLVVFAWTAKPAMKKDFQNMTPIGFMHISTSGPVAQLFFEINHQLKQAQQEEIFDMMVHAAVKQVSPAPSSSGILRALRSLFSRPAPCSPLLNIPILLSLSTDSFLKGRMSGFGFYPASHQSDENKVVFQKGIERGPSLYEDFGRGDGFSPGYSQKKKDKRAGKSGSEDKRPLLVGGSQNKPINSF
jgi:hypothetical protein